MGRIVRFFRAVLSPRLGTDGSAASSVQPPHHVPIGVETNAVWHRSEHTEVHRDRPARVDRADAMRAVDDLHRQREARDRFRSRGTGDDINQRMTPGSWGGQP